MLRFVFICPIKLWILKLVDFIEYVSLVMELYLLYLQFSFRYYA